MKKTETKTLVLMAMYCALFVVMDRLSDSLNLFAMANGGKLNFGPIILLTASYHLGVKKGLLVSFTAVLLMFVIGSIKWYGLPSFLLDYLLSYMAYGLSAWFPNFGLFYSGVLISSLFRVFFSTLAGVLCWETAWGASLIYNLTYLIPTTIVAIVMVPLLCVRLKD